MTYHDDTQTNTSIEFMLRVYSTECHCSFTSMLLLWWVREFHL